MEKYLSSVLKRPLLRTFCDFRCCNFKCVFLAFSKIRLLTEAGLQSAVSPCLFKINENFFYHCKLHFPFLSTDANNSICDISAKCLILSQRDTILLNKYCCSNYLLAWYKGCRPMPLFDGSILIYFLFF